MENGSSSISLGHLSAMGIIPRVSSSSSLARLYSSYTYIRARIFGISLSLSLAAGLILYVSIYSLLGEKAKTRKMRIRGSRARAMDKKAAGGKILLGTSRRSGPRGARAFACFSFSLVSTIYSI